MVAPKNKRKVIYDGKVKTLIEGHDSGTAIQHFKDDIIERKGTKKSVIPGKGVINNRISEFLMKNLEIIGIPTHLVRRLNMREQLIYWLEMFPLEIMVRNVAAGCLCKRINMPEGSVLPKTIIEFYYKDSQLPDPLISEDHMVTLGLLSREDIDIIKIMSLRTNDFLQGIFTAINIRLVDFRLEFGKLVSEDYDTILIANEISPDTCHLWDYTTNEKFGHERFVLGLDDVEESYKEIAKRLKLLASDIEEIEVEYDKC